MRIDSEYWGVETSLVVRISRDIKGFDEWTDIPYMYLSGVCPARDMVRL